MDNFEYLNKIDVFSESLDTAECSILMSILYGSQDKIIQVPRHLYDKFHNYLLKNEHYEDVVTLEKIQDKITNTTLDELFVQAKPTTL